jgi:transcriptional regulator with XRE-family HTH domain
MTNKQLKNLKDRLWAGADQLRANSGLKSTEYATPILGLIFLRFAQSKYSQYEAAISAEYEKNKGTRAERPLHEIAIEKCGYYLPPVAKFDYLLNLPESENLAEKTKTAMEEIEKYTEELADTLPKDIYYNVNSEDDPLVLNKLFKVFKDIPTDVSLDIFGEIYEYFLSNFALAEGQGGGEFFTPSTVVRYMVEVLALREGVKLSQAKIGEMIGTTQSSVNRFESTMTAPILTTLLWYADFFDVSLDYIFGRTDNPQGKLYEYRPKVIENDSEMRRFIEMCFEPNSPMNERLRQTLIEMLGEAKE